MVLAQGQVMSRDHMDCSERATVLRTSRISFLRTPYKTLTCVGQVIGCAAHYAGCQMLRTIKKKKLAE